MVNKFNFFLITLLMLCSINLSAYNKRQARQDLNFAYNTIKDNHPGYIDSENPDFKKHLNKQYRVSRKQIRLTSDQKGLQDVIEQFFKSFDDSHLKIFFTQKVQNSINKKSKTDSVKFSLKQLEDGVVWIALPTFWINTEQQNLDYQNLINQIKKLKDFKIIVFDLRGNRGGNSALGFQLLKNIFGEDYCKQVKYLIEKDIFVDWRVTQSNLEHLANFIDNDKMPEDSKLYIKKIYDGMKGAILNKQKYFREKFYNDKEDFDVLYENPVKAKIITITDSGCVSACLDFIDDIKALDSSVILLGETTNKDSLYMDIRELVLPSGIGKMIFPIKVYRNRPRKNNQPYEPDIPVLNVNDKDQDQLLKIISIYGNNMMKKLKGS